MNCNVKRDRRQDIAGRFYLQPRTDPVEIFRDIAGLPNEVRKAFAKVHRVLPCAAADLQNLPDIAKDVAQYPGDRLLIVFRCF